MSSPNQPEHLPLSSPDLAVERLARLRELLPGAFAEDKLVPGKLAELVGAKAISTTSERYGLSYAGRAEALREMLAPSPGTLRPDREKSVAWDATENLILEGDNLHVLKLLQSAYVGAVKLIYIDPPYNTGNDFVYPDDFRAGVKHYKELTQLTPEILRSMIALKPQRVLCLDVGFHGNDQLKTNTVLEMKSHGVQFQTV